MARSLPRRARRRDRRQAAVDQGRPRIYREALDVLLDRHGLSEASPGTGADELNTVREQARRLAPPTASRAYAPGQPVRDLDIVERRHGRGRAGVKTPGCRPTPCRPRSLHQLQAVTGGVSACRRYLRRLSSRQDPDGRPPQHDLEGGPAPSACGPHSSPVRWSPEAGREGGRRAGAPVRPSASTALRNSPTRWMPA